MENALCYNIKGRNVLILDWAIIKDIRKVTSVELDGHAVHCQCALSDDIELPFVIIGGFFGFLPDLFLVDENIRLCYKCYQENKARNELNTTSNQ